MSSSEIKVVLKTPAQKTEDQTIKCNLDWTVLKLKNYISENYPLKPSVNNQRLIYSGHLLKDNNTLKEIFQPSEEDNLTFTLHLVLNQKDLKENNKNENSLNNENTPAATTNQPTLTNTTQFSFNLTNDSIDLTNLYVQQMQQYQQMYVSYMAQYLNANNSNQTQSTSTVVPLMMNPMFFNPFLMPNLTNLNTIVNPSTNNENNQTVNERERNDNQEANDDNDLQNNWLDIFWNILILFSLASASISRTLFILAVSFIYYLYKAGFFSFIRIRLVNNLFRNVNRNRNLRNEDQLQQMMDNNLGTPDLRNRRNGTDTNENTNNQQQSYFLNRFRFFFMVVGSLFSSLMPNDPGIIYVQFA